MTLLTLEINDIGIMAAAGQPPRLLPVDQDSLQSPGFAVADRKKLVVGRTARKQAHLSPRFTFDAFWDHLSTETLPQRLPRIRSHAEIAYLHLEQIWKKTRPGVDEVVMAVPVHFDQHSLGIILSIARELSIPLRGFVALATAAANQVPPGGTLLHMDLHLHRFEVTRMAIDDRISPGDSRWLEEKGLLHLQRRWAESVATEFVQTTRFDPLHRATTEQELYDRLPALLADIQNQGSAVFEMRSGQAVHRMTISRDLLTRAVEPVFTEIRRLAGQMRDNQPVSIQYTHRLAALPGFESLLADMAQVHPLPLPLGAAALGAADMWRLLGNTRTDARALYFTSRPCQDRHPSSGENAASETSIPESHPLVTHVLYGNTAYPLSAAALVVGSHPLEGVGLVIGDGRGILPQHCSLRVENGEALLETHEDAEILLDGRPVRGRRHLSPGQTLQIGTPAVSLRLITCLKKLHET